MQFHSKAYIYTHTRQKEEKKNSQQPNGISRNNVAVHIDGASL
jgi:hypothetical protein